MNATLSDEAYKAALEALWESTYKARFECLLDGVREAFRDEGWTAGDSLNDFTDEEFQLELDVTSPAGVQCGVRLTLVESLCRDGSTEGIAFSLDLDAPCGHVVGGLTPYNYTDALWVSLDDTEAIAARWALMAGADPAEAVYVLDEHVSECREAKATVQP